MPDEEKTAQNQPADPPEDAPEGTEGEGEGDAAQRQLANAQSAAKRAARDRDRLKTELATLKAELAKSAKPEESVDPKAIAEAAKAEARAEVLRDRALDKVEVLAAKGFANPTLAAKLLAGDVDQFINDGKVDTEAIQDALADLLKAEPYLASTPPKRFQGTGDNGHRSGKEPELDELIREATKRGDVMEMIRLENQKLIPHVRRMQGLQS